MIYSVSYLGSTRIRGVQRTPPRMTNFAPPYLGLSTFLRPDIGVGSEGMLTLEVLPHESALTRYVQPEADSPPKSKS